MESPILTVRRLKPKTKDLYEIYSDFMVVYGYMSFKEFKKNFNMRMIIKMQPHVRKEIELRELFKQFMLGWKKKGK